jgi:hypothetical protein
MIFVYRLAVDFQGCRGKKQEGEPPQFSGSPSLSSFASLYAGMLNIEILKYWLKALAPVRA